MSSKWSQPFQQIKSEYTAAEHENKTTYFDPVPEQLDNIEEIQQFKIPAFEVQPHPQAGVMECMIPKEVQYLLSEYKQRVAEVVNVETDKINKAD